MEKKDFNLIEYFMEEGFNRTCAEELNSILQTIKIESKDDIEVVRFPQDSSSREHYRRNNVLLTIKNNDITGTVFASEWVSAPSGISLKYMEIHNNKEKSFFRLNLTNNYMNKYYGFTYNRLCKNVDGIKDGLYCVRYDEDSQKSVLYYYDKELNIDGSLLKNNPGDFGIEPDNMKVWNKEGYVESAWQCLNYPNLIQNIDNLEDFEYSMQR